MKDEKETRLGMLNAENGGSGGGSGSGSGGGHEPDPCCGQ